MTLGGGCPTLYGFLVSSKWSHTETLFPRLVPTSAMALVADAAAVERLEVPAPTAAVPELAAAASID